jgi:L-amino acid N-acyltransferase YncA
MQIRPLVEADYPSVKRIFLESIATGQATFETTAPEWPVWNKAHLPVCRLGAVDEAGELLGWAALTPTSDRSVYAGVASLSIYIAESARRQGVGRALLTRLLTESEAAGLWTIQAGIFADNEASIRLHTICGFRMVGYREKIGKLNGVWRDSVLMERRSQNIL